MVGVLSVTCVRYELCCVGGVLSVRCVKYLWQVDALEGDAVLLGGGGLGEQLQQREAIVKVHVLLNAILLAQRQQHVRPTTCRDTHTGDDQHYADVHSLTHAGIHYLTHARTQTHTHTHTHTHNQTLSHAF